MHPRAVSAVLLALGLACGTPLPAPAATGARLEVGVVVLPSKPATQALASLPLPPGSRAIQGTAFGGTYHAPASLAEATEYLRTAMHAQGYRLLSDLPRGDGARLVWRRDKAQVEFECREVLGRIPATRITVVASVMREG